MKMFRHKMNLQTFLIVTLLLSLLLLIYLLIERGDYHYDTGVKLHIGMRLDAILNPGGLERHQVTSPKNLPLADGGEPEKLNVMNTSMYRYSVPRDHSCFLKDKLKRGNMPDVHSVFADPMAGHVVFVGLKFLKHSWHRDTFGCVFPDGSTTKCDQVIDDKRSVGYMPQYVVVITCPLPERYRWRARFGLTLRKLTGAGSYDNITVCTSGASANTQYKLAICTMVKSADSFIPEWLDFHRYVGVEHVFIYDNENEDVSTLGQTVKEYVDSGFVTLVPWAHSISANKTYLEVQIAHENDCIWRHKHDVDWMIKIDVDEYIQPMDAKRPRVTDYLSDASLRSLGALRIQNWFFGHPPHITPRGDSIIARNVWRSQKPTLQNTGHDKNILRPFNVHYFKIHNVKLGGNIISADPRRELRMVHYRGDNPRTLRFELPDYKIQDTSMLRLRELAVADKGKFRT